MSTGSVRVETRRRRRLVVGASVLVGITMVGPASGTALAAPDDDGGTAGAGAAAVDILSNVDAIDLDLLGFTGEVVAPAEDGTVTNDEGLDVIYDGSRVAAEAAVVMATRQDADLEATATVGATSLTLLGQQLATVGSSSSSAECSGGGIAAATAEVTDVDLGARPVSLGANELIEHSRPFESDAFTPGTANVFLTAETGAIVVDGAAQAFGLLVTVVVDGEPAGTGSGVVEGAIDGFIVLAVSYCVPADFLADTGSDLTAVALWAGVLLVTGGALLQLGVRRRALA